jgi:hypothetical protein
MKFSVIIPTMYYHVEQLQAMLAVYNDMEIIGEILIINNSKERQVDFNLRKVRVIGDGVNKYVNPSWEYGVINAKCENVVIANDDITVTGNIPTLFEMISTFLKKGVVVGPSTICFPEYGKFLSESDTNKIRFKKQVINKRKITYGFGTFMFMKRNTFLNTAIPKDFLVWYGDHILCLRNEAWEFSGVTINTRMRGTTTKIPLHNRAILERKAFENLTA